MKFLRLSVFFLILANLLLYAWGQGYLGSRDTGREPDRLEEQRSPEKLRVVSNGADASASDTATTEETGSADCRRIAGFGAVDAKQWMAAAQTKMPKAKLTLIPGTPGFDVAIVGLRGSEGAEAKRQELKKLGIDVPARGVKEGGSVSLVLASLPTEDEAKAYLRGLNGKGVRTARIVARPAMAQVEVAGAEPDPLKELLTANGDSLRIEECPAH